GVEVQHQPPAGVVGEGGGGAARKRERHREGGLGEDLADGGHAAVGRSGVVESWAGPQNFIGSMIASRLRWSQNSRKSPRSAAMCMFAGTPMVTWAENMSAPVCIARSREQCRLSMVIRWRSKKSASWNRIPGLSAATTSTM